MLRPGARLALRTAAVAVVEPSEGFNPNPNPSLP